jgi:hypothetical protein
MLGFWRKGEPPAISNTQRVAFTWFNATWSVVAC